MTLPLPTQRTDAAWARRIHADRGRAARNQTPEQQAITCEVMRRAIESGAAGFALTGSTARNRRTPISDLDYHVIGKRPDVSDLTADVDIVCTSPGQLRRRLLDGDDFAQWTVLLGCILYDTGPLREAASLIASGALWPNAQRKLERVEALHTETLKTAANGRSRRRTGAAESHAHHRRKGSAAPSRGLPPGPRRARIAARRQGICTARARSLQHHPRDTNAGGAQMPPGDDRRFPPDNQIPRGCVTGRLDPFTATQERQIAMGDTARVRNLAC